MTDDTTANTPIRDEQVAEYLRSNPDFFKQQPGLLADLTLPHESGNAISLVERQVSILRERNMDMRHRMSSLLDNARDNDRLFDKTKRLVLALLEGKSFKRRRRLAAVQLRQRFQKYITPHCCYSVTPTP